MKSIPLTFLSLLTFVIAAFAADDHGHSHEKKNPGPNGGRVIEAVKPHLEFFVTADRKVQIIALTASLQPDKLSGQIISVIAGERSNPTKLELIEQDGKLISSNTLPEGNDFPVSVSIKTDASSKAIYEKFHLNMTKCPGCKLPEYACICGH